MILKHIDVIYFVIWGVSNQVIAAANINTVVAVDQNVQISNHKRLHIGFLRESLVRELKRV